MKYTLLTLATTVSLTTIGHSAIALHIWDGNVGDNILNVGATSSTAEVVNQDFTGASPNVLQFNPGNGYFDSNEEIGVFTHMINRTTGDLAISVNGGSAIEVTGFTFQQDGILAFNFASNIPLITTSDTFEFSGSSQFDITTDGVLGFDSYDETSFSDVNTPFNSVNLSAVDSITINNISTSALTIPEPSSSALIALSGLALLGRRRRA